MKYTIETLAKEIESAVEWLKAEDCGCSTIKLDDKLAVCVGWSDGFDPDDETVIHGKPATCAIVAAIKVWTTDDMRTDIDWIDMPYFEDGSAWGDEISIHPDENYEFVAECFLKDFETLSRYDIQPDGKIIGEFKYSVYKTEYFADGSEPETIEDKKFTNKDEAIDYIESEAEQETEELGDGFVAQELGDKYDMAILMMSPTGDYRIVTGWTIKERENLLKEITIDESEQIREKNHRKVIKCCNCDTVFESEDDLSYIVEISELGDDGCWYATDREFLANVNINAIAENDNVRYEIFKGCPECMGDEYLSEED